LPRLTVKFARQCFAVEPGKGSRPRVERPRHPLPRHPRDGCCFAHL